jgi:hypothetical protein
MASYDAPIRFCLVVKLVIASAFGGVATLKQSIIANRYAPH